jgi:phage baseplate assembly protein gpV
MARGLVDRIVELERRLADNDRRNRNRKRFGTIVAEKPAEGLYRVQLKAKGFGGKPFLSPWLPVKALASGGLKIQAEPTMGQQVAVVSESGDLTDGEIDLSVYDDANPRPHDRGGEFRMDVQGRHNMLVDGAGNQTVAGQGAYTHSADGVIEFTAGGGGHLK